MADENLKHAFDLEANNDLVDRFTGYLNFHTREISVYNRDTAAEVFKIQQITVSDTPPTEPYIGQLWLDTDC